MFPYILLCAVISMVGMIMFLTRTKSDALMWFFLLVLICFAGFRGTFTSDHLNYNNYFLYID